MRQQSRSSKEPAEKVVQDIRRAVYRQSRSPNDMAAVGAIVGTTAALGLKLWHEGMQHLSRQYVATTTRRRAR